MTDPVTESWEKYVRAGAVPPDLIDDFLDGPSWARFDPELGYVLQNSFVPWGIDGSSTLETFGPTGARTAFLYAGATPRIASYGDSFTESNQVSDGETWQEYLAAHLGEPVANFGIGGYGVYQAYRRMLLQAPGESRGGCVILYIWGDDPIRSLLRTRWLMMYPFYERTARWQHLFHGNPWPRIELDLDSGDWIEYDNPLRTPESLRKMSDPDWLWEFARDDLATRLYAFLGGRGTECIVPDLDREATDRLAELLGVRVDWSMPDVTRSSVLSLLMRYAQRATNRVLDLAREATTARGSRLLVALNGTTRFGEQLPGGARKDQEILDHLNGAGFDYFDMNEVHEREYAETTLAYFDYLARYLVNGGHYNPRGNHLFAYAIKDKVIDLLDPKPRPYRERRDGEVIDFRGYLPGYPDDTQ